MSYTGLLELSQRNDWDCLLERIPVDQKDIYFTPRYYNLYEDINDGTAKCFVFEKNGEIAMYPFLLNSVNKLGYVLDKEYFDIQGAYGYNGVVSSTHNILFLKEFNNAFSDFCHQKSIIAEFVRFHPLLKNHIYSEGFLTILLDRETVYIDLRKEYSEIFSREYSSKNRNMIRKAINSDYTTEVLNDPADRDFDIFMEIYYTSMKAANAENYYFFRKQYFIDLFQSFKGNIYIFNAKSRDNEIVCSAIFFHFNDFFHYHLSGKTSGSDNSVNNYLLDRAIAFARGKGATLFHLGGGRSSGMNDSLLNFKKNFSKSTAQFFLGKRIHNPDIYNKVVDQWENKCPGKIEKYKHYLLKYRY